MGDCKRSLSGDGAVVGMKERNFLSVAEERRVLRMIEERRKDRPAEGSSNRVQFEKPSACEHAADMMRCNLRRKF